MDDTETGELVTLLYTAYQIALTHQKRLETRAATRLRVARFRTNAPTTLPQSDAPQRELRREA